MAFSQLSLAQRYQIKNGLELGFSIARIALLIHAHRSTVYREIKRNGYDQTRYYPDVAHRVSIMRRHFIKKQYKVDYQVRFFIETLLDFKLSLEQIHWVLNEVAKVSICLQTLYNFIHRDYRQNGSLYKKLPYLGKLTRARPHKKRLKDHKQQRPNIRDRSDSANHRTETGHLEIDTMHGLNHQSALLTIVDRKARWTLVRKLKSFQENHLSRVLIKALKPYQQHIKSITSDNGFEFGQWRKIRSALNIDYYFTDPYASWQRGTNENTNGLIRRVYPKKTDFRDITNKDVKYLEKLLNIRPRKCLGFRTPEEVFFDLPSVWRQLDLSHLRL